MVRSMIVVVLAVIAIVLGTIVKDAPAPTIDYRSTWVAAQREVTAFTPLAPRQIPQGWRVESVRYTPEPATWHLAFLTSSSRTATIEQGKESAQWLKDARPAGQWQGWKKWSSPRWRALSKDGVVICGTADFAELQTLIASLAG